MVDLKERAAAVRLLVLDADGTLTDGGIYQRLDESRRKDEGRKEATLDLRLTRHGSGGYTHSKMVS